MNMHVCLPVSITGERRNCRNSVTVATTKWKSICPQRVRLHDALYACTTCDCLGLGVEGMPESNLCLCQPLPGLLLSSTRPSICTQAGYDVVPSWARMPWEECRLAAVLNVQGTLMVQVLSKKKKKERLNQFFVCFAKHIKLCLFPLVTVWTLLQNVGTDKWLLQNVGTDKPFVAKQGVVVVQFYHKSGLLSSKPWLQSILSQWSILCLQNY